MTAAVIMLLAQEGKLRFDDPVSKYVAGVPNGDDITIAELLKMRSGLYNYTSAPELAESLEHDPTRAWTPEEVLAIAFKRPPNFAPGAEYEYCNTNYALLGLIVEKLAGAPLAKIFQDRFFGPLGMTAQPCSLPARRMRSLNHTPMAICTVAPFTPWRMRLIPPSSLRRPRREASSPMTTHGQNPSYAHAAGGVISTADDLAIWIRALVGGKVFNADTQRLWLDSLEPEDPSKPGGQKYGYGITELSFGPNHVYFHGGEMPGYNSFMGYDPVNDVTLIIWTSLTLSLEGQPTANSIMLKVLDQIYAVSPLQ